MSFAQKQTLTRNLNAQATRRALDQVSRLGLALPGAVQSVDSTGTIVTVEFNVTGVQLQPVTMPVAGAEYIRFPIQPGDKGVAFPASTDISCVSGLGTNTAPGPIRTPMNLSALVWVPCGSKDLSDTPDANSVVIYGPGGVILKDEAAGSSVRITGSSITLTHGSSSITINASGITITGSSSVTINGKNFLLHTHNGVQTGGGVSGPVT